MSPGDGDEAAASLLATHNTIVLDQVAAFGGHDVRSTGDGFLVVFDSARAAVSCALAIQDELTEREHPIRVRIGLNAGEVLQRGDELFGAAINLATRVMDRAERVTATIPVGHRPQGVVVAGGLVWVAVRA